MIIEVIEKIKRWRGVIIDVNNDNMYYEDKLEA